MKALDVFRNKRVPELTFKVWRILRQNNAVTARGVLSDGTRTAIRTTVLAADWELVSQ